MLPSSKSDVYAANVGSTGKKKTFFAITALFPEIDFAAICINGMFTEDTYKDHH